MQRAIIFGLVTSVLVPTFALQAPLVSAEWNINRNPNPNGTDHLVFETVHSLLQHWPNTRMRNGHNVVPGVIPKGTLLYHGTNGIARLPPGPEWVATDPEHSYLFCQPNFQQQLLEEDEGCWHLTLATTRPLKVVYFDGSSAAKIPYGSMDTQDLLLWGESRPENTQKELQRIEDLCKWAKPLGLDGLVRMQMDFEIVLCDFTSGVSVVSWTNLACIRPVPPLWPSFIALEVMNSGSWHNHFPGETRVQLDLTGLTSFYDTHLVPSLVASRAGQERWDHRVRDISSQDMSAFKSRLEATLTRPSGRSSGIDWKTLIQVIVDRFAQRLELIRYLLNAPVTSSDATIDLARKIQTQLRIMLTPYLTLSATPSRSSDKTSLDWSIPIYKECATIHTTLMEAELDSMTDSERLLFRAVRGTTREICRVVTRMWAGGVFAGIDLSLNTKESVDVVEITEVRKKWVEDLDRLMGWLDWSVWVKCDPACAPEKMCYLPTWPVGFPGSPLPLPDAGHSTSFDKRTIAVQNLAKEMSNIAPLGLDDWPRPKPRCLSRVAPYEF